MGPHTTSLVLVAGVTTMVPAGHVLQDVHEGALDTVLKVPFSQFEQTASLVLVPVALT